MDFLFNPDHYGEERDALFQSSDSLGNSPLSQRLLVLVGDEPWSQEVVAHALHRAMRTGTEVHFLSILTTQLVWGMSDVMAASALDVSVFTAQGQYELAWAATAAEEADVPYTTSLRWGNIPATLRYTVKTARCALIVMGPYIRIGCEPLSGRYLARRVAVNVGQPVLVVPQSLAATGKNMTWQRALVVIDGATAADDVMEHAFMVTAQEERASLCLLQVTPPRGQAAARARAACTLAAAQAAAAGVAYNVQHATGDIAAAILKTAAAQQCDVVMLGISARNVWSRFWHGCPTTTLLEHTTLPVLLIPSA